MTTPNYSSIKDYADFQKNFENFQKDLNNYDGKDGLVNQQTSLQKAYQSQLGAINWKGKNPWVLLISVMQLILDPGTNMINNMIDQKGTQSECQTSLLRCQNDLQKITTEKGNGSLGVEAEAHGLNKLIAELNGSQAQGVFGADGCANLNDNLLTLRHQIWVGSGDTANNPTLVNGQLPSNCYFAVGGWGPATPQPTMTSFGDMIDGMSQQGGGAYPDAIEANTQMTNAFGANTSTLQSVSAQTKEELTQWVNVVKTLASAGSSFGHSISQVTSTAQQNMRPQ